VTGRVVGGGLGVVPELERQVVHRYHRVTARELLDGYTLAQLTPGPIYGRWPPPIAQVLAVGFVGRIAGLRAVTSFP
jgi:chromate transport protein ChrA